MGRLDQANHDDMYLLWFEFLDEPLVLTVALTRVADTQQGPFARQREVEIRGTVGQNAG